MWLSRLRRCWSRRWRWRYWNSLRRTSCLWGSWPRWVRGLDEAMVMGRGRGTLIEHLRCCRYCSLSDTDPLLWAMLPLQYSRQGRCNVGRVGCRYCVPGRALASCSSVDVSQSGQGRSFRSTTTWTWVSKSTSQREMHRRQVRLRDQRLESSTCQD